MADSCWSSRCLSFFSVMSFLIFLLTFITSFVIFKLEQHGTDRYIPFISDTGAIKPESCIFGQMLNLTAMAVGLTAYFRTKQVEAFLDFHSVSSAIVRSGCAFSLHSYICGVLSALGMSIVANFQLSSTTLIPHVIGACMAFGLGMVYIWMQTLLSLRLRSHDKATHWLVLIKLFVVVAATVAMVTGMSLGVSFWLTSAYPDVHLHLLNSVAVCEWITAVLMGIYYVTFAWDFSGYHVLPPQVIMRGQTYSSHLDEVAET